MPPSHAKKAVDRLEEAGFTRQQAMAILSVLNRMLEEASEEEQAAAPPPWAGPAVTLSGLQSELAALTGTLGMLFAKQWSWLSRMVLAWFATSVLALGVAGRCSSSCSGRRCPWVPGISPSYGATIRMRLARQSM